MKNVPISEKPMTIHEVARTLGVSPSTVSAAFSGKGTIAASRREEVLASARALGYRPNPAAQRLRSGRCMRTVGLFTLGLDLGVGTQKVQIIQRRLSAEGFDVPLYAYGAYGMGELGAQAELMATLCQQRPRAIVAMSHNMEAGALEELDRYQREGGIVLCYDIPVDLDCDQVIFDREYNTYMTTRHLLELGHRRIGLHEGGLENPASERLKGFRRALAEYGVDFRPAWIYNEGFYEQGGMRLAEQFLQQADRPTGICIVNDRAATAFVNEVQRAGLRVPTDVSVVAHDNDDAALSCAVPLTAGTHPCEEIGRQCVLMLMSRLDGSYVGPARKHVVRSELTVRLSSAPPPPDSATVGNQRNSNSSEEGNHENGHDQFAGKNAREEVGIHAN